MHGINSAMVFFLDTVTWNWHFHMVLQVVSWWYIHKGFFQQVCWNYWYIVIHFVRLSDFI
jgi:hypothetical protein